MLTDKRRQATLPISPAGRHVAPDRAERVRATLRLPCPAIATSSLPPRLRSRSSHRPPAPLPSPRPRRRRRRRSCRAACGRCTTTSRRSRRRGQALRRHGRDRDRRERADRADHAQRRRPRLLVGPAAAGAGPVDRRRGGGDRRRRRRRRPRRFAFAQPIPAGRYRLAIDYTGKIGTQANGLFAIDYDTPAGRKRALFTQFENSDARRFIPSWDEPAYKATFALEATVPAGADGGQQHAGRAATDLGNGGRARVRFAHLAEDVDLPAVLRPSATSSARPRATAGPRSASSRGAARSTRRGSRSSPRSACCASTTTTSARRIRCPSSTTSPSPGQQPVLRRDGELGRDLHLRAHPAARPDDLHPGRQAARLRDRRARDRAPVVRRPRHHALVGRPVAQRRLRLVDGRRARPRSCIRSGRPGAVGASPAATRAMERDALATTHPVVQHVETVEQASQAFDAITYSKGEAVIRMLEGYVGDDAWRAGVRALHEGARLRQHRLRRPVARGRGAPPASRSSTSRTTSRCSRACR